MKSNRKQMPIEIRPRALKTLGMAAVILISLTVLPSAFAQNWQLTPIYGNSAGVTGQVSMTTLKTGTVVTAVSNSTNNLEVIAWNDTGTKLARTGSATGDEIFPLWGVAVTTLDSTRVVTAAANWTTGLLEVSVWKISSTGSVAQQGATAYGGVVSGVSIATLDSGRVITAVENNTGGMTAHVWDISSTSTITSEETYSVASASSVAVVGLNASQAAVAYRNGKGNLEIIAFSVSSSGTVSRQGTVYGGAVAKVAISYWPPNIITAVETETTELLVSTWSIDASGDLAAVSSVHSGNAYGFALCVFPTSPGTPLPFTAAENSADYLSLAVWQTVPESGGEFDELTDYNGETYVAPQVAAASEGPGKPYFVVTATKNKSSDLQMKVWQLYQPTE